MGAIYRPVAFSRAACRVPLGNVVRKLRREPAQPRIFRLEPCQAGGSLVRFVVATCHGAPKERLQHTKDTQ
jgi:hypothetical protein